MYRMVRITTYKPCYKQDFIRLNKQWIESYFRLEQSDLDTFLHIDESIIGCGGQIFLAVDEKETVVGCCALKPHPASWQRWLYHLMPKAKVLAANLARHCLIMPVVIM